MTGLVAHTRSVWVYLCAAYVLVRRDLPSMAAAPGLSYCRTRGTRQSHVLVIALSIINTYLPQKE
jgi:hypothetical protein